MLPSLVAEDLRAAMTSFLGTTFALGDDDVRAEGTEFSRVHIGGAQSGVIPLEWLYQNGPEPEQAAMRGRERSLFYVACSRARDELVITWTGSPSPFLPAPAG